MFVLDGHERDLNFLDEKERIKHIQKKIMLSTPFLGKTLPTPMMNAAGVLDTTEEELRALDATSRLSVTVSKSTTLEPREGNPHPRYHEDALCSVNSTGLANKGYLFYDAIAPSLTKPYIVSVASLGSLDDMKTVVDHLAKNSAILAIEINLSCPNIVGKSQPAYDFERLDHYLKVLTEDIVKPWGIKLPPYFDMVHFEAVAKILQVYKPHYLACINSVPLALHIDPVKEAYSIVPNKGRGGLGGASIRQISLANVQTFRLLMPPTTVIVGCGGITSGSDLLEHILAGANLVQIGTQLLREGPEEASRRIAQELQDLLESKGYKTLDEVVPLCLRG